ncbi:DUF3892 domain-containing protein [Mycobacteroides abscessus]|uniref:DUF3892 domain-containing protein n=1 Tax=Mycobacteroides abscessus TaxID=36809 RepID=UPI0009A62094|nr:DUF3892 domain-containing protein [Mycobacteroides abscessus]RIT49759.1 DUF3892 domain-containing protein [Mycobacteroides abscessus]SKU02673.1 Uncharacterised protein [Mycobacteroides abscessus subsp. massiliense]SKU11860.1 Uncharacterised protein [Mycobacteroides abscessus subsp. massiliense]
MTIEIVQRHMVGGQQHEHIDEVKYINSDGETKRAKREAMVEWLDKSKANQAIVRSRVNRADYAYVGVVRPSGKPAYIRTFADGKWTDNLLALPEY